MVSNKRAPNKKKEKKKESKDVEEQLEEQLAWVGEIQGEEATPMEEGLMAPDPTEEMGLSCLLPCQGLNAIIQAVFWGLVLHNNGGRPDCNCNFDTTVDISQEAWLNMSDALTGDYYTYWGDLCTSQPIDNSFTNGTFCDEGGVRTDVANPVAMYYCGLSDNYDACSLDSDYNAGDDLALDQQETMTQEGCSDGEYCAALSENPWVTEEKCAEMQARGTFQAAAIINFVMACFPAFLVLLSFLGYKHNEESNTQLEMDEQKFLEEKGGSCAALMCTYPLCCCVCVVQLCVGCGVHLAQLVKVYGKFLVNVFGFGGVSLQALLTNASCECVNYLDCTYLGMPAFAPLVPFDVPAPWLWGAGIGLVEMHVLYFIGLYQTGCGFQEPKAREVNHSV